jgi:hypothetical protein
MLCHIEFGLHGRCVRSDCLRGLGYQPPIFGTCQSDHTGAGPLAKEAKKNMSVGSYESVLFQHTMWSENNIVKTFSNFHSPSVILQAGAGVLRSHRVDELRKQDQTDRCLVQHNKRITPKHFTSLTREIEKRASKI